MFDRPIFIVSAPRSGSTLLYEVLTKSSSLWSIGGESHAIIESIQELGPGYAGRSSNRLSRSDATASICENVKRNFINNLRNHRGEPFYAYRGMPARMLEKTPKNSLRIPFLDGVFPDALFIFLYREWRANVSSIMDAWSSGRYVTYRILPGWNGEWSLLLPPGWEKLTDSSLVEISAFQWRAANEEIMASLSMIPPSRWAAISYESLVRAPVACIRKLCRFIDIPVDDGLLNATRKPLLPSSTTLTAPDPGKWRKHAKELERASEKLDDLSAYIRRFVKKSIV